MWNNTFRAMKGLSMYVDATHDSDSNVINRPETMFSHGVSIPSSPNFARSTGSAGE